MNDVYDALVVPSTTNKISHTNHDVKHSLNSFVRPLLQPMRLFQRHDRRLLHDTQCEGKGLPARSSDDPGRVPPYLFLSSPPPPLRCRTPTRFPRPPSIGGNWARPPCLVLSLSGTIPSTAPRDADVPPPKPSAEIVERGRTWRGQEGRGGARRGGRVGRPSGSV